MGKEYIAECFKTPSGVDLAVEALLKGGYTGNAKNLETLIIAASTGASGVSIAPTSAAPAGTGIASFTATQAGTYTNYGGVVVAANSFAIISRSATGVFSISQTALDLTSYAKIVDTVIPDVNGNTFGVKIPTIQYENRGDVEVLGNAYFDGATYYGFGFFEKVRNNVLFDIFDCNIQGYATSVVTMRVYKGASTLVTTAINPANLTLLEEKLYGAGQLPQTVGVKTIKLAAPYLIKKDEFIVIFFYTTSGQNVRTARWTIDSGLAPLRHSLLLNQNATTTWSANWGNSSTGSGFYQSGINLKLSNELSDRLSLVESSYLKTDTDGNLYGVKLPVNQYENRGDTEVVGNGFFDGVNYYGFGFYEKMPKNIIFSSFDCNIQGYADSVITMRVYKSVSFDLNTANLTLLEEKLYAAGQLPQTVGLKTLYLNNTYGLKKDEHIYIFFYTTAGQNVRIAKWSVDSATAPFRHAFLLNQNASTTWSAIWNTSSVGSGFYQSGLNLHLKTSPTSTTGTITKEMLNFSTTKYNYPITWTSGIFLQSNGTTGGSASFSTTNFIPLLNNSIYLKGNLSGSVQSHIIIYDKDKFFIANLDNGVVSQDRLLDLSAYPTAKFIRFFTNNVDVSGFSSAFDIDKSFKTLGELPFTSETVISNKFAIPNFVDSVINRQLNFYLDGVSSDAHLEKEGALLVTNPNALFRRIESAFRYEPITTTTDFAVTIKKANSLLVTEYEKTFNIRTNPKVVGNGTEQRNICICGDSLVEDGNVSNEIYLLLNQDADYVFNQIGTRGSTAKHEGRGSWSWETYTNPIYETTQAAGKTNAFMNSGVLDFQNYFNTNFSALTRTGIDYFLIALGTNDVSQGFTTQTDASIAVFIAKAKIFVDALLSSGKGYPNCKIALGLPSVGAIVFNGGGNAELFRSSIIKLNQAYIDTFDNGKYHANVTCFMHGALIDRKNSFPFTDVQRSSRLTTETVREYTNSVHPLAVGYKQWADGYYSKIRAFLNGKL
jgi:hypothetical protein